MRRFRSLVLVLVFALVLGAFAGIGMAEEEFTIAFIAKSATSNWGQRQGTGTTRFMADHPDVTVIYDGPETVDSASQIAVVQNYVAQEVDAIIVVPLDIGAMEPTLQEARENGIIVVTHEASSCTQMDYDVEAVANNEFGATAMRLLVEQIGEVYGADAAGTVIYMVGVFTNGSHNEWADAGEAYAKENTTFTVGERVESGETIDGSYGMMVELIKAYPDLLGIVGSSSADLPGICNAVEEAGLSGKILVSGLGIPSNISQYLESGVLKKSITWDPSNAAYACCSTAYKLLKGEEITEGTDLGAGYSSIKLNGNVIIGKDINEFTIDNYEESYF